MKSEILKKSLNSIYSRKAVPDRNMLFEKLQTVTDILFNEPENIRPRNNDDFPGGLLRIKNLPAFIIPDLHGRVDFLLTLLASSFKGNNIFNMLDKGEIQIICLGDAMHGERRAAERWINAAREYNSGYKNHELMDMEITESFSVLETVLDLKTAYPDRFHFLKGNHENIRNIEDGGNHPFRKFASEGEMTKKYVEKFYGEDFIESLYIYEKQLPLLAAGSSYLVSHAEPGIFYPEDMIINSFLYPDLVHDLTWTANDEAEEGSVDRMLESFFGTSENTVYFGGHRINYSLYNLRANGKFIQINNPSEFAAAYIENGNSFLPDRDIFFLDTKTDIKTFFS